MKHDMCSFTCLAWLGEQGGVKADKEEKREDAYAWHVTVRKIEIQK